jgi:hypothetical protein
MTVIGHSRDTYFRYKSQNQLPAGKLFFMVGLEVLSTIGSGKAN